MIETFVAWNGDSAALAPYCCDFRLLGAAGHGILVHSGDCSYTDTTGCWSLAAAALAVLGIIVAAFGMGRAQAEARTRWAATARVLGATRRTVAFSSVVETAIVSLAGIAVGLAAGVAAVAATLGVLHARHPDALLPTPRACPARSCSPASASGSSSQAPSRRSPRSGRRRVAPVAALKPVTPVSEAQVSRTVGPWWVPGIFAGSVLAWCVLFWFYERGERSDDNPLTIVLWLSMIVLVVSGVALVIEGSRVLVRGLAEYLSRTRRPWLIAAGDGLAAHRRIYTFASIAAFTIAAAATWTATANAAQTIDYDAAYRGWGEPPLPSFDHWWNSELSWQGMVGAVGWITGIVTFVAVVVTLSARATFAGDAATRSALGLSANAERVASAARQWFVMGSSAIIGALLGWLAPLAIHLVGAALSPNLLAYSWHWNVTVAAWGLAAAGLVIVVMLAVTLAGSLAVGLFARPRTPVEALRRAAG